MIWIRIAAWAGFLGVALGAFGAHGLKARLEEHGMSSQFQTGVLYHLVHVFPLALVGLLRIQGLGGKALDCAPYFFLFGMLIFSGSLYLMGVTGMRKLGMITPIGGLLLLLGWAALAWTATPRS
jgi:uncharacterized membrane protein YgdD (TMEM256/DUF423 family)